MHEVEPAVFVVGETQVNDDGLKAYLTHIGAENWETDALNGVEEIIEVMGRGCYKSFGTGLNPNVTRTREGNGPYIDNILESRHGSVTEHAYVNLILCDVSRVLSHELVRHRVGVAISQESMRYLLVEDIPIWLPPSIKASPRRVEAFKAVLTTCEWAYKEIIQDVALEYGQPWDKLPFKIKKKYTSAARRLLPNGIATNIGWSCNIRALRHVIEMRTSPEAEEEIRMVFGKVAEIACDRWPFVMGDYKVEVVDGLPWYKTENGKI